MDNKRTGKLISELRKEKGLSQNALAEALGVTDKAVSKWETGRGAPEISLLIPLSRQLDISVAELLNGEKAENNEQIKTSDIKIIEYIKKRKTAIIKTIIFTILTVIIALSVNPIYHLTSTVNSDNTVKIEKAAMEYFEADRKPEILEMSEKAGYYAYMLGIDNEQYTLLFERDKLFNNRISIVGGKVTPKNEISCYCVGSNGVNSIIFSGYNVNGDKYTFEYKGIKFICPIENNIVFDLFIESSGTFTNPGEIEIIKE